MISDSTVEAVYPLVDKLTQKGIMVSPYPTTPIDTLVNICHVPLPANARNDDFSVEQRLRLGSTCKDQEGVVKHDVAMEEMVEVIAETVRANHDIARNIVNPIIKEVVADVEEYLQACESVKNTNVKVTPIFYRPIWNSPVLQDMVERYAETPLLDIDLFFGVPFESSKDTLLALAKTGGARFDKELVEFFDSMGEGFVVDTFRRVFGKNPIDRVAKLNQAISPGRYDEVLLIHLFARKLLAEPPEGIEVGLDTYRKVMSEILAQSGRFVYSAMNKREANRKQNYLLANFPGNRDSIGSVLIEVFVNGDVYNQWLKDGGSPEILLGSFVTDQERGYKALLEKSEYYTREWEKQERVMTTNQRLNRFNNAVEGMQIAITKQINQLPEEQLLVSREVLHTRLREHLHLLYGKFYENLYVYARKMICTVLFPHTMALQLLCAIDNVKADYPDMEVREAALLATIEIVALWVAKLCKVDYVSV